MKERNECYGTQTETVGLEPTLYVFFYSNPPSDVTRWQAVPLTYDHGLLVS